MTGNCNEALREIYEFLDGELTAERKEIIRGHLEGCNPCLEAFDFEAELRIIVAAKCREQAPDGLRDRILQALDNCEPAADTPGSAAEL